MKSSIRKEILALRNAISDKDCLDKSALIQKRIMELPEFKGSQVITLYASCNREASTSLLFEEAIKDGKKVLFPAIRGKELFFLPVSSMEEMVKGPKGILAPHLRDEDKTLLGDADLVIIPGLAFDSRGGRIGYGAGYYDRSLGKLSKRPNIVAMAYEFQLVDDVFAESHDVKVDAVVTENRVIYCS